MKKNIKNQPFLKRVTFAVSGIRKAFKRERSFQIQWFCVILLLVFCLIVRPSAMWCALFAVVSALVLALEMLNTALESVLDKLHPEEHHEIGFAKDCLAGAVLLSSLGALIVFVLFLVARFF